jgi:hypothetical protein
VAIKGETIHDAAKVFAEHVNSVLARTVTPMPVISIVVKDRTMTRIQLAFRQGAAATSARIATRYGRMGLYVGQVLEAEPAADGLQRLRTVKYTYTVSPSHDPEPIFRWEYVRNVGTAKWCRHHLQGPVQVKLNRQTVELNDLHLPTGYVPFEEILRFCIVDLGVKPLTPEWDDVLRESYAKFRTEFTL